MSGVVSRNTAIDMIGLVNLSPPGRKSKISATTTPFVLKPLYCESLQVVTGHTLATVQPSPLGIRNKRGIFLFSVAHEGKSDMVRGGGM